MKPPQLSLRDLFWLALVCGLAFCWLIDHFGQEGRHRNLVNDYMVESAKVFRLSDELQKLGYTVENLPDHVEVTPPERDP